MYARLRARYGHYLIAYLSLFLTTTLNLAAQHLSLSFRILDEQSHQPIASAVLRLGKHYTQTDSQGRAFLSLPSEIHEPLLIHAIGYHDLRYPSTKLYGSSAIHSITLKRELRLLQGVQVAGARRTTSVNSVSAKISTQSIQRNLGRSLAQLLTEVSGVTTLQTGTTTAKPVIHGMYGTRVLIVNQGVRQSGQQWGEDHAPEVDIEGSSSIQVIKGAEAVRYGAEAIAGAVLLDAAPLPFQQRGIHGRFGTAYATNGHRTSSSLTLEGAIPHLPSLPPPGELHERRGPTDSPLCASEYGAQGTELQPLPRLATPRSHPRRTLQPIQ